MINDGILCWVRRVAGITVPAFVERGTAFVDFRGHWRCVAGITVPAFVERVMCKGDQRTVAEVSPGLRSRPSLSGSRSPYPGGPRGCVAGITVPAFVERPSNVKAVDPMPTVSPGLRSRPSLSVLPEIARRRVRITVSPGLRSRPSLSATASS